MMAFHLQLKIEVFVTSRYEDVIENVVLHCSLAIKVAGSHNYDYMNFFKRTWKKHIV